MVENPETSNSNMGIIKAICISDKRGLQKTPVESAFFEMNHGIVGDAHAGNWHRQVSLLDEKDILEFQARGAELYPGCFGENLIVEGIDISSLPIGSRLQCGDVVLELTQRGKECHTHCQIYHKMGECIMPRLGVFSKVLQKGEIKVGDEIKVIEPNTNMTAAVITLSDKGFKGEREDVSGPTIIKRLEEEGYEVVEYVLIPDDPNMLKQTLIRLADQRDVNLILTTGGTGCSLRDNTPEATKEVIDREVPGISEAIRSESLKITPHAMLSRGVSGIRGKSLIINLPGSPKACLESMEVFIKPVKHAIKLIHGEDKECARK